MKKIYLLLLAMFLANFLHAQVTCNTTMSTNVGQTITSGTPVVSTINIASGGPITDINVINLVGTHTLIGEVGFTLTSPQGTNVTLIYRMCGGSANFNLNVDESGIVTLPCPYTGGGTYTTQNGDGTSLNDFFGENSTGTWTLTITDYIGGDDGTLTSWGLEICTDDVAPVANCQNITVQLNTSGAATILPANVNNGSSDNYGIATYSLDNSSFDCSEVGANSVTLTVTDLVGNTDNCTATVTVQDNVLPEAYCQNDTIYLDASGNATASALNINNGSTDACGPLSYALNITAFSCDDVGTNPVVLTVTDNNSNESTCPAIITVADTTPPTADCVAPFTAYLDENGDVDLIALDIDDGSGDNCGDVTLDIAPMSFDCADTTGTNTVTLTVTDDSGNTSTCTTIVTVEDSLPPVAVCEDITIELDASGNATITADDVDGGSTDNCGVASISVDSTSFNCEELDENTVVLTVTDFAGNTSTCDATVTVQDNLGIVAECHDTIVYLDDYGHINVPASWIDNGSWDNCIDETNFIMTLIPNSFDCSDTGIVDVQLTVYDGMGDSDVCGARIDVRDSTPPEVYCHPITVELDSFGEYTLTDANTHTINVPDSTRDNCTPDADLAFWVIPDFYDCDDAANAFGGDVEVTLYASDVSGNIGTCETIVTVEDNQIPVAECKDITIYLDHDGDQTIAHDSVDNGSYDNCDITYLTSQIDFECIDECSNTGETCNVVTLTVTDQVGNFATCTSVVTVRDTVLPDMACKDITVYLDDQGEVTIAHDSIDDGSWDACGIYSYETSQIDFTCADECSNGWDDPCNIVTLTVTDNNLNTDQCTAVVTVLDTVTPEMVCHDITIDLADISTGNGLASITPDTIDVSSNDACGVDSMWLDIYDFDCDNVCTNIAGDILAACPTVTLTVRDENFNTSTCTQTVTVRDNDAPHAECQNVTVYLDSTGYGEITAIGGTDSIPQLDNEVTNSWDNCAIDTMWLDRYEFYCADIEELVGTHTVKMSVEDIHLNTSTCEATITVKDTVIPFVDCQDVTIYLSDNEGVTNFASIIAIPDSIAFNNVLEDYYDNCEVKFELDTSIYYCEDVGIHTATITATDSAGNFGTCEASVTVQDSFPPHVFTQDISVCLDVDGNFVIDTDTIDDGSWDNCAIDSMWLDTVAFTCEDIGVHTVTLTVRDIHMNTASETALVTVQDCMAPDVQCKPLTVTLYENGEYVLNDQDYLAISEGTTDNCTPYEELIFEIEDKSFECIHVYDDTVSITVYATDASGNTGMCVTHVVVIDTTPPVMKCKEVVDVYLDENGEARIYPILLNDGDDIINPVWARTYNYLAGGSYDACGIDSAWVSQPLLTCGDDSVEVDLFMIDPSLNQSTCTSIVVVHDTLPPTIGAVADVELVVDPGVCEIEIDYPAIVVVDNCETVLELTAGLGVEGMFPLGTTTESWVATDDAGNTTTVSFNVVITTTNAAPTINAVDDVVAEEDAAPITVALSGITYGNDCEEQDVTVYISGTNEALITPVLTYTNGNATGSIELTVAPEMSGSAVITITVEDSEGGNTTEVFMINVGGENDAPFIVTPIADQTVNADHVLKVPISPVLGDIFDDVDNSSLDIEITGEGGVALPVWVTIIGDTIVCTPTISDMSCVNIVVTATDAGGLSVIDTFEICAEGFAVSIGDLGVNQFEVQMYPNPTRGVVNLDISSGIHDIELSVLDITGKTVLRKQYSAAEKITFDMSGKVSGMYFVHINTGEKQIVKKLVVDRK